MCQRTCRKCSQSDGFRYWHKLYRVAGPDELEGKPVGTVYIGIKVKGKSTVVKN